MTSKNTAVLNNVKARMQNLKDELDNLRDSYDLKCKECETLVEEKNQVIFFIHFLLTFFTFLILSC